MPTLSITKSYDDGTALTESQLDDFKSSIETFFNTTKIDADNIATSAITTDTINAGAVTAVKLASDAVTTVKILDLNVTTGKINDLAVTTGKLAADAVTTAKITDSNVTLAKIANIATARILGRTTASSGVIEELTVGNGLTLSGGTLVADFASAAEMETATSTTDVVTPGRVQNHPGVAKAWALIDANDTTPAVTASYNVTSVADGGVGTYTVTFTTAFADTNFIMVGSAEFDSSYYVVGGSTGTKTTTTATIISSLNESNAGNDIDGVFVAFFGDQ